MPAVPGLGTRFALARIVAGGWPAGWPGSGAAGWSVGWIGVATIERSRDNLPAEPRLYGADWDLEMSFFGVEDQAETIEQLSAAPDVEAVGTRSELLASDGEVLVRSDHGRFVAEPVAYEWLKGSRPSVVSAAGRRAPVRPPSGPELAHRLEASIGDTIVVEGYAGDVPLRITGWFVNPGTDELDGGLSSPPTASRPCGRRTARTAATWRLPANVEGAGGRLPRRR